MAKTKKELIEEAKTLNIEVDSKNTTAQIQELISSQKNAATDAVETPVETPADEANAEETKDDMPLAKAGKRSAKALEEEAEKLAKEERKASGAAAEEKPKAPVTPTRSRAGAERQTLYVKALKV